MYADSTRTVRKEAGAGYGCHALMDSTEFSGETSRYDARGVRTGYMLRLPYSDL